METNVRSKLIELAGQLEYHNLSGKISIIDTIDNRYFSMNMENGIPDATSVMIYGRDTTSEQIAADNELKIILQNINNSNINKVLIKDSIIKNVSNHDLFNNGLEIIRY